MNLVEALKAVAPAVGDGKIVASHAYVRKTGALLTATNGKLWALAEMTPLSGGQFDFVARHAPLLKAMDRDNAQLGLVEGGIKVQCGRSRITLKTIDPEGFPYPPTGQAEWAEHPFTGFLSMLKNLSKFCANNDGHIWQQGVHFTSDHAFSANSHALACYDHGWGLQAPFTLPPWAVDFILAHDTAPGTIEDRGNTFRLHWPGLTVVSTKLIEEPPDNIVNYATNLATGDLQEIPPNLKEVVERAASYDVTNVTLDAGVLTHRTEEMEIEEDVGMDTPRRTWGTKTLLAALELATHMDLSDHPARWKGGLYTGAFSGL